MVPTWTGKPGKQENIFQSGKSGKFENTGRVREIYTRNWKSGNFTQNIGKVREFWPVFIFIFSLWFLIKVHLLNIFLIDFFAFVKNTGKWGKILEKRGKFVSPKIWEPYVCLHVCQIHYDDHLKLNWRLRRLWMFSFTSNAIFLIEAVPYGAGQGIKML